MEHENAKGTKNTEREELEARKSPRCARRSGSVELREPEINSVWPFTLRALHLLRVFVFLTVTLSLLAACTTLPAPETAPTGLFVDPAAELGPINPLVYGVNYGPWIPLGPDALALSEQAGYTLLRYPGGEWGDQNNLQGYQVDQLVALARRFGAEPMIHVRLPGGTPEQAADLVRYANVEKGYGVKYWAIGNEPSLYHGRWPDEGWDTERYNREWRTFAEAMRAVDPDILLVGPETHQYNGTAQVDPRDTAGRDWLVEFLKANGDLVDIVAVHRYPFPNNADKTPASLEELRANPPEWDAIVRSLRHKARDLTGRDLPVGITEVNSHWSQAIQREATPDSFYNAIWWADVLGRLIRGQAEMVAYFDIASGPQTGFGLVTAYEARPTYYVYLLYKQMGQTLLQSSSVHPEVTITAARRDDGALTLMVVNRGPEEVALPLRFAGETPPATTAEVWRLDKDHRSERVGVEPASPAMEVTLPAESATLYVFDPNAPAARAPYAATVWAPYATVLEQQTLTENADVIREANFFWYTLQPDGSIAGAVQSPQAVETARAAGMRVVPSIANGGFDRERVAAVIGDPERRAAHVADIVALVEASGFDGIDIDYESLHAEDREDFSLFIEALSAALHAKGKYLSVTVHPKTGEDGDWGGPQAQDWARLGAAADAFKIMVYDYHHGAGEAGPIAPLEWADAVLTYAATVVPPAKTTLGVPLYGYDWTGSQGQSLEWRKATALAKQQDAAVQRDPASGEVFFSYGPEGRHTVYFNDAKTLRARLDYLLARHPDIAGISAWRLGGEDPATWQAVRQAFGAD